MLVVVPDRYDFEFSIKADERKRRTEDSTHKQKIEIIGNWKVPRLFQSTLEIRTIKPTKYVFQKVLTSFQTIYLTNLDSAADRVTSQSSERVDFYCDHEEADTKMFAYIKFLCNNIRLSRVTTVSPDTDAAMISFYESALALHS